MSSTNTPSDRFWKIDDCEPDPDISVGGLAVELAARARNEISPQLAAVG